MHSTRKNDFHHLAARIGRRASPLAFASAGALLAVLCTSALAAPASDRWPVFRGDAAEQGVASETLPDQLTVVWKQSFKDAMFEATAAIDAGVIYIGGLDGYFRALDLATGKSRWQFHSELGFKAPAAVQEGRIFVGDCDGVFFCLDAKTGEKRWSLATDAEINGGANFFRGAVLIGSQDGSLYALDAQSGKQHWKYTIENMIQCSPTVIENRVFIAGCDGKLHILEMAADASGATKIAGKKLVDIQDPTGTTPAASGDRVYFGTQGARFLCIDWRKAEMRWAFEPRRKQPFQSSAAVSFPFPTATRERQQQIVVVGGRDRAVHAMDAASGRELWQFTGTSRFDSSPVIAGKRAYIGSGDGRLYALDLATGEVAWQYEAGGGFVASPAIASGRLIIGNDDGELYCFGAR